VKRKLAAILSADVKGYRGIKDDHHKRLEYYLNFIS
jgi:hypothetical protein